MFSTSENVVVKVVITFQREFTEALKDNTSEEYEELKENVMNKVNLKALYRPSVFLR